MLPLRAQLSALRWFVLDDPMGPIARSPDDEIARFSRPGGHFHDLLLNGVGDELGFVVDVELAHQVELVRLHRLDAETKDGRDLPHRVPFGQHFDDFTRQRPDIAAGIPRPRTSSGK